MAVDFLAFGPHPDDGEIGCGAVLRKMKALGHTTGIVDMTTGDMGWGAVEERLAATGIPETLVVLNEPYWASLGSTVVPVSAETVRLAFEDIASLVEGGLGIHRCAVAAKIRRHRPQIIFAPYYDLPIGRGLGHNDHYKTGQIVANAYNLAHLRKAPLEGVPHQAKAIYFYFLPPGTPATFIVDVSDHYEDWLKALECHVSQFANPDKPRPAALPAPTDAFIAFARYWGWQIGVRYGQAFLATAPLRVGDPLALVKDVVPRP